MDLQDQLDQLEVQDLVDHLVILMEGLVLVVHRDHQDHLEMILLLQDQVDLQDLLEVKDHKEIQVLKDLQVLMEQ